MDWHACQIKLCEDAQDGVSQERQELLGVLEVVLKTLYAVVGMIINRLRLHEAACSLLLVTLDTTEKQTSLPVNEVQ